MQKETIEVSREKIPKGYSKFSYLNENSGEVLDKLTEFAKGMVYKHTVRHEQENERDEIYNYFQCGQIITKQVFDELKNNKNCQFPPYAIPYCDLVCYLDIYYQ
jgi:hypothetical protein